MTPPRAPLAALALLTLLSTEARAQQWGGSPPPSNTTRTAIPARSAATVTPGRAAHPHVALVDPNAYAFVFGAMPANRSSASSGGSWNGAGVQWGGSPPSSISNRVAGGSPPGSGASGPRRPMIAAADNPALAPDAPGIAPSQPRKTRAQQYLMERGKP